MTATYTVWSRTETNGRPVRTTTDVQATSDLDAREQIEATGAVVFAVDPA